MLDVGLVGLGTIARTHVEVLGSLPDVRLAIGVDPGRPATDLPDGVPVVDTLAEAVDRAPGLDLLVLATPTPTHVALATEALELFDGTVLVEKPLSDSPTSLVALESAYGHTVLEQRLRVAHHFAFSPEVRWAARLCASHPEWGTPIRIVSSFNDAYTGKPPEQLRSLVSSWIDSAGNQLSLLSRFAEGWQVVERAERDDGFRSVCRLAYGGGEAVLVSNWLAADSSKQSSLYFANGVEVRMDHTSMTVLVLQDGALVAHRGDDGSMSRKFAHYDGLYRSLISGDGGRQLGYGLARELTAVLAAPVTGATVAWH